MRQQTKQKTVTENRRISGTTLYTPLSTLPERFTFGPHTAQMSEYLARRWYATSYGWWKRSKAIEYNQEWTSDSDNNAARWGRDPKRYRWVEHPTAVNGLRFVGKAHEIRGNGEGNIPYFDRALIDHNGWYVDNWQDETVCGEVYQLPARNGESIYVPAIEDHNGNDGALIDFRSSTADLTDAIRWADSMAEKYAEDEREYQAKDAAETRIAEIDNEVKDARAEFKALAKEIRANCDKLTGLSELGKLIRKEYKAMKAQCRKLRAEKAKLQGDFWTAAPNGY